MSNNKNQVFQALYGQRLDEAIASHVVEHIIDAAMQLIKTKPQNAKEELALFKTAINDVLKHEVEQKMLSAREADFIKPAMIKTVEKLLLTPQKNAKFWKEYKNEPNYKQRLSLLSATIKEQMKPILYDAGIIEHLKRDVLVSKLGGLRTAYKNTNQKELGYQKLRSEYPLRTVELRTSSIKTTDFNSATRLARVMDSLGYLDTVNHITNHELHNPQKFNVDLFFGNVSKNFEGIYKAVLQGAGKNPAQDSLLLEIKSLEFQLKLQGASEEVINRQVYQFIKDQVEKKLDSAEAFALSRAVEFSNKTLSSERLFKETYEESFKRAGLFAVSNITGQRIMTSSSLHKALADKSINMFELYEKRESDKRQNRTEQVFSALSELTSFADDYKEYKGESKAPELR
ncbi:hypothetical protein [Legionella sp. km772]|uniref:hypothetical protein n=1 Tax=Legionella sp. km772 TaxID=2498111 RepID=UPI000F8CB119|nr:hypothetical protein [Legionella sp. km772]RUR07827.1 hypothetical protein ELY15_11780 [Legionella sp. km772]